MKTAKHIRWITAVLAVLLVGSTMLSSCQTKNDSADTTASTDSTAGQTETAPSPTDPDPVKPEDVPKTGDYTTTTNLTLPDYTYGVDDPHNNGIIPATRDVWSDTWVATDDLGRSMPAAADTRAPSDRQVGIFYFLWRDRDQETLSEIPATDHHAAYLEGGLDAMWESMKVGSEGHPHYWAEPYFGYYSSNDEWVLRKHAYMLANAGVDFVFFDTTNNNLHSVSHKALLKVWEQVRQEGYRVPKIVFLCGGFDGEFYELYNSIYKPGLYEDLWFYWDDKPLVMLSGDVNLNDEVKDFFTIRYSWAVGNTNWYEKREGKECWPWSCDYPQRKGFAADGTTIEQMVVMCGSGATKGRSSVTKGTVRPPKGTPWEFGYSIFDMENGTRYGAMFHDHFERALKYDPPVIMITGWNEWIAGRWSGAGAGAGGVGLRIGNEYVVSANPNLKESNYFVDALNPEYSRDIEPMKGGFGDNYLYQMAENVRRYKGTRQVESAFGQWAIDLAGSVGQWYAVGPEYRDYEGDTAHRLSPGHVGGNEHGKYVNFSGRNDIVTAKVSNDTENLYFYVACADTITDPSGANWMNLFIDADNNPATGWHGYDYLLNRNQDDTRVLVEKFVGVNEWKFETVGTANYVRNGNVLQIRLPKALIGFTGSMDFKWADNSVPTGDIMEFLDQGDAAPDGRYNYRYTLTETAPKLPSELPEDLVVLKVNSYNAFVGGQMVRLVSDNTNGVALASDHALWLPVDFLKTALGVTDLGSETVYNHYGIDYVRADELIRAAGKTVTVTPDGLVIIAGADRDVSSENLQRILYRALP